MWKSFYLFGFWICISSGDSLHLWFSGALVYLTLFDIDTIENSWGVNWIYIDITKDIKSFGSILIFLFCDIEKTATIYQQQLR